MSLVYGYSIWHDERKDIGLFAGIDFIVADTTLEVTIDGVDETFDVADDSFGTPFPTVGFFANWNFWKSLAWYNRFQYFGVEFNDISGSIFRGDIRLQHDTFRYANFYVGYELLGGTASVDGQLDQFDFFSHGPTVGVVFRF